MFSLNFKIINSFLRGYLFFIIWVHLFCTFFFKVNVCCNVVKAFIYACVLYTLNYLAALCLCQFLPILTHECVISVLQDICYLGIVISKWRYFGETLLVLNFVFLVKIIFDFSLFFASNFTLLFFRMDLQGNLPIVMIWVA